MTVADQEEAIHRHAETAGEEVKTGRVGLAGRETVTTHDLGKVAVILTMRSKKSTAGRCS